MKDVSPAWIDNQLENFTSQGKLRITLSDMPQNMPFITSTGNEHLKMSQELSNVLNVIEEAVDIDMGTFELNRWILDGSITPSTGLETANTGFISDKFIEQSNSWYEFTWGINEPQFVSGISMIFDNIQGEYPLILDYSHRIGSAWQEVRTIEDNRATNLVLPVNQSITGVRIRPVRWCLLNRRFRLNRFIIGLRKIWENEDILNYQYRGSNDPILTELPREEITFEIKDLDRMFHPLNPNGVSESLDSNMRLEIEYGFSMLNNYGKEMREYIRGGYWWLQQWSSSQSGESVSFTLTDTISINRDNSMMNQISSRETTLKEIISNSIPYLDVRISPESEIEGIRAETTENDRATEILQLATQAQNATIKLNRDGKVVVSNKREEVSSEYEIFSLTENNYFSQPHVTLLEGVREVRVFLQTFDGEYPSERIQFTRPINSFEEVGLHVYNGSPDLDTEPSSWINVTVDEELYLRINRASIDYNFTITHTLPQRVVENGFVVNDVNLGFSNQSGTFPQMHTDGNLDYEYSVDGNNVIINCRYVLNNLAVVTPRNAESDVQFQIDFGSPAVINGQGYPDHIFIVGSALSWGSFYKDHSFTIPIRIGTSGLRTIINGDLTNFQAVSAGVNTGQRDVLVTNKFIQYPTQTEDVANRMMNFLKRRRLVEIECRIDPRLELLDIIWIDTDFGRRRMLVTNINMTFNGWYHGRIGGVLYNEDSE